MKQLRKLYVLFILATLGSTTRGAVFFPLGDLPGGIHYSRALAVSADGKTVVGESSSINGGEAFQWKAGTMAGIGDLSGGEFKSEALGISPDGSTIVGMATGPGNAMRAFKTMNGVMEDLGSPSENSNNFSAEGASLNGEIVLGNGNFEGLGRRGFRWQSGSHQILSGPNNAISTTASDISWDGNSIAGYVQIYSQIFATRWDGSTPYLLPSLSSSHNTAARGISGDGQVVVGDGGFTGGTEAIAWRNSNLFQLGDLPGGGFFSVALASSYDGSTIVGRGESAIGYEAFVWTHANGMRNLRELLLSKNARGTEGWILEQANGVSADGQVIVGWGINPNGNNEAWLVDLTVVPEPSAAISWTLLGLAMRFTRKPRTTTAKTT